MRELLSKKKTIKSSDVSEFFTAIYEVAQQLSYHIKDPEGLEDVLGEIRFKKPIKLNQIVFWYLYPFMDYGEVMITLLRGVVAEKITINPPDKETPRGSSFSTTVHLSLLLTISRIQGFFKSLKIAYISFITS